MGATDVAAALSWVHQNIDLFNGDAREIVAVGYGAGAFHVASLLAHPEFQTDRADVAAVVLVSGIYRVGKDASDSEKAYFGTDASQYDQRSVFPGILNVDAPIVLAWAANDPANLVSQGEVLKKTLVRRRPLSAQHAAAQPRRHRRRLRPRRLRRQPRRADAAAGASARGAGAAVAARCGRRDDFHLLLGHPLPRPPRKGKGVQRSTWPRLCPHRRRANEWSHSPNERCVPSPLRGRVRESATTARSVD